MTLLVDMERQLTAADLDERLAACWEVFDLGLRLADEVAWQDGVDAASALAAGAACAAGRDLLPLPAGGSPAALEAADAEAVARALDRAATVLDAAARDAQDPSQVVALHTAATHARDAAGCLRAMASEPQ